MFEIIHVYSEDIQDDAKMWHTESANNEKVGGQQKQGRANKSTSKGHKARLQPLQD